VYVMRHVVYVMRHVVYVMRRVVYVMRRVVYVMRHVVYVMRQVVYVELWTDRNEGVAVTDVTLLWLLVPERRESNTFQFFPPLFLDLFFV
jgi:hypothetical protein